MKPWENPKLNKDPLIKHLTERRTETLKLLEKIPNVPMDPALAISRQKLTAELVAIEGDIAKRTAELSGNLTLANKIAIASILIPALLGAIYFYSNKSSFKEPEPPKGSVQAVACSHSIAQVRWDANKDVEASIKYSYRGTEKECNVKSFQSSFVVKDLDSCSAQELPQNSDYPPLDGQSHLIQVQLVSRDGGLLQKSVSIKFPKTEQLCVVAKAPQQDNKCPITEGSICRNFFSYDGEYSLDRADLILKTEEGPLGFLSAKLVAPMGAVALSGYDLCDLVNSKLDPNTLAFTKEIPFYTKDSDNPRTSGEKAFFSRKHLLFLKTKSGKLLIVQAGGTHDNGCTMGNGNWVGILTFAFSYIEYEPIWK